LPCEQLKIADNYSGGELDDALAAARQSIVYSCEEAGAEVDEGRALIEALYLYISRRDFARPALGAWGFHADLDDR
jgi:hypothetical protein